MCIYVYALQRGFLPIIARKNKKINITIKRKNKINLTTATGEEQRSAEAGISGDKTQLCSLDLVQAHNFCQDSVWLEPAGAERRDRPGPAARAERLELRSS